MKESDYLNENSHILQRLKALPIIKTFDEDDIKELLPFSKMKEYESGETIIEEGDTNDKHIYFLLSGKVSVKKDDIELFRLEKAGDIFGEMAVIENRARSASVEAFHKSLCLAVDATYAEMLKEEKRVNFMYILFRLFSGGLAKRLRDTNEKLVEAEKKIVSLEGSSPTPLQDS